MGTKSVDDDVVEKDRVVAVAVVSFWTFGTCLCAGRRRTTSVELVLLYREVLVGAVMLRTMTCCFQSEEEEDATSKRRVSAVLRVGVVVVKVDKNITTNETNETNDKAMKDLGGSENEWRETR